MPTWKSEKQIEKCLGHCSGDQFDPKMRKAARRRRMSKSNCAIVFWSGAHYTGYEQAYYALPERMNAPIAGIAIHVALFLRDVAKVLVVTTHHELSA